MKSTEELLANAPGWLVAGEHQRLEHEMSALCEREPDNARAHFLRAAALHAQGRFAAALDAFERSSALDPSDVQALAGRAAMLHALDRVAEAEQCIARAIETAPQDADLLANRARLLEELGRPEAALSDYRRALEVAPENPRALQNLAALLGSLGRTEEALQVYTTLLQHYPGHAEGHANLGNLLLVLRRFEPALAACTRAVELAPGHARAHADCCLALAALGRFEAAREAGRRAVSLAPRVLLRADAGEGAPAVPDPRVVYLLTGYDRLEQCDWHDFDRQATVFTELAGDDTLQIALADQMALLHRSQMLPVAPALRARLARRAGQRLAARAEARLWLGGHDRDEGDRIRVGYVSSDYGTHPGALTLLSVLREHDRATFEITAFAVNPGDGSRERARLRDAADRFIELHDVEDDEAAWRIHEAGCDLLVFRGGYTQLARPGILAQHPAPLQLTWAGYHGTLGGGLADYHVSELISDPPAEAELWDEARVFLPYGPLPFPHAALSAPRPPPRAELGLPERGLVLAAMHRPVKIDPLVFDAWMRVMTRLPDAVLWLLQEDERASEALRAHALSRGVAPARLVFAPRRDVEDHIHCLAAADLWLDTRWYGSHASLLDALAAGVPAVACTGNAVQGRLGAAILHAAGLSDCVTHDIEHYEQAIGLLAADPMRRTRLREALLARQAPLFDVGGFVRTLEKGYLRVWQRHLAGLPPCDTVLAPSAYRPKRP